MNSSYAASPSASVDRLRRSRYAASPLTLRAYSLSLVRHPSPPAKKKRAPDGARYFLAGGEGFEPPLTESESVVLPLDDPPNRVTPKSIRLALRVLRRAASFAQANFLAFNFPGITGNETGFAQRRTQ